jgi:hypothetical protein
MLIWSCIVSCQLCGHGQKNSLKHADFFLDVNRSIAAGLERNYTPPAMEARFKVHTRRYFNDECTILEDLPTGSHVLTIHTNHTRNHATALSHVITFL